MESIFKIKEEYKAAVVGFNNSGLPLGSRTDLHLLALMAQSWKTAGRLRGDGIATVLYYANIHLIGELVQKTEAEMPGISSGSSTSTNWRAMVVFPH